MERPFFADVEQLVTDFIRSVGGKTVVEYLGSQPKFKNADYYFEAENVIAELKCLEKDIFSDSDFERNERLIDKWLAEGMLKKIDLIPIFMGKKAIPEECLADIYKLTKETFQTILKKAHKQLAATKEAIGNDKTYKILLLCNDGNYFLNTDQIILLVHSMLYERQDIMNIDCTIYFTVNQISMFHPGDLDRHVWVPGYNDADNTPELPDFVNQLGRNWWKFLDKVTGVESEEHEEIEDLEEGIEMLKNLNYVPKEVIYKKKSS